VTVVRQGVGTKEPGVGHEPASITEVIQRRLKVMHHPWRVRILEVLNERDMSVSQFVDEQLIPELTKLPRDDAISSLAYHFRVLREAGAIEIVEQHARRGSTELVCGATTVVHFTDEQWSQLNDRDRQSISQLVVHSFLARAECAMVYDSFDSRPDRHLSWLAMEVDEQGWSELVAVLNGVLDTVTAIHQESRKRLTTSGERAIRTTWGQLHFESPPLPAPPLSD
jgi:DNA-binding transcriptional ArsR family regulator